MSSFSWLDYSEHDRRRALDVIDQFRERDTVDELGIGSIRDAIADLLFPGTSTIQTRAAYFLLIPWMYQRLERKKTPSEKIGETARKFEIALIDALAESDDSYGTIGVRARKKLRRLPTHIYWMGLGMWGIRLYPGSQDQYHRSLDRWYAGRDHAPRADDGEPVGAGRARNWHAALPEPPDGFPNEVSLALRREDADFLRERILNRAPATLLAFMVDHDIPPEEIDFPWEHPRYASFPARNREELTHARRFSEVMLGAQLLYNLILAELSKRDEIREDFAGRLAVWQSEMEVAASDFAGWDREEFWRTAKRGGLRLPQPTRLFVERWWSLAIDRRLPDVAASREARTLVTEREKQLKRGQARVTGGRPLELWGGDSGSRQLDYRWNAIVWQLLTDIQNGRAREAE